MSLADSLIAKFVELCEIPEIYENLIKNTIIIKLEQFGNNLGLSLDCLQHSLAVQIYNQRKIVAIAIFQLGIPKARICYAGSPYRVIYTDSPERLLSTDSTMMQRIFKQDKYKKVIDFAIESQYLTTVTSMETDTCLFTNDKGSPERIIWTPAKYIGFNYKHLWRDSMADYERLQQALKQEGRLDNFKYNLRRVDDSMGEFISDYFLVEDFLGSPVRVAINREWKQL